MFSKSEEFEARIKSKNGFWGRYYDIVKNTVGILLFTYLLMTVMEVIHLSNETAVEFFETEGCFFKILFNSVFIILLLCVFTAITRSIAIANTIVSLIIGLFCYALNVVCILTGDPLLPSDFVLAGSLDKIVSFVEIPIQREDIFAGLILVFSIALGFVFFRKRYY